MGRLSIVQSALDRQLQALDPPTIAAHPPRLQFYGRLPAILYSITGIAPVMTCGWIESHSHHLILFSFLIMLPEKDNTKNGAGAGGFDRIWIDGPSAGEDGTIKSTLVDRLPYIRETTTTNLAQGKETPYSSSRLINGSGGG